MTQHFVEQKRSFIDSRTYVPATLFVCVFLFVVVRCLCCSGIDRLKTTEVDLRKSKFGQMGDCQNYGPFLGPNYNTGPNTGLV